MNHTQIINNLRNQGMRAFSNIPLANCPICIGVPLQYNISRARKVHVAFTDLVCGAIHK